MRARALGELDYRVDDRVLAAGQSDHERNLEKLAVQAVGTLEELAVVGERVPVISQNHDDRPLEQAEIAQRVVELTEVVVDVRDLARVQASDVVDPLPAVPPAGLAAHRQYQLRPPVARVRVLVEPRRR